MRKVQEQRSEAGLTCSGRAKRVSRQRDEPPQRPRGRWAGRVFGESLPRNHANSLKIKFPPIISRNIASLSKTTFSVKPHVSVILQLISDDPVSSRALHRSSFYILIPKKCSPLPSVSAMVPTLKCVWEKQWGAAAQRERLAHGTPH